MNQPPYTFEPAAAAIWTPKRMVIATGGTTLDAGIKIHFVISGLSGCEGTSFDAHAIATQAAQAGGSFKNIARRMCDDIETPLTAAAQFMHDNSPDDFKKHLSGKNATEVLVFALVDGEIALAHIGFKTKKRGKEVVFQVSQKDYPNADTDIMSIEIITAGTESTVDASFRKNVTGQQALVYPEESLHKFASLALAGQTPHIFKLSV